MGYDIDRLIEFVKSQENLIPALVRNLKTSFIVDLIKAFLRPENGEKRSEILEWLFQGGFFDEVIAQLSPIYPSNIQDNASEILVAIMGAAGEVPLKTRPYESSATIARIFAIMFDDNMAPTPSFSRGMEVLNGIVGILELPKPDPNSDGPAPLHPTLQLIFPHLDKFKKILNAPPKTRIGSSGEIQVAGEVAILTLRFLLGLVRARSIDVDKKLIELDILTDCMNMFFKYISALLSLLPFRNLPTALSSRYNLNNFVHTAVEKLFVSILSTYRDDPILKLHLLTKTDLPRHIVEGMRRAKEKTDSGYFSLLVPT